MDKEPIIKAGAGFEMVTRDVTGLQRKHWVYIVGDTPFHLAGRRLTGRIGTCCGCSAFDPSEVNRQNIRAIVKSVKSQLLKIVKQQQFEHGDGK